MNILVVSPFFTPDNISRTNLVYKALKKSNNVKIIYSEFSHNEKEYLKYEGKDYISIKTCKYKKNISMNRIIGYLQYSIKVNKFIKKNKFDVIYIAIPPNIVSYKILKTILNNDLVNRPKVLVDIVDLWPEALPIKKVYKKILKILKITTIWRYFRNYSIKNSDYIICESMYFAKKLEIYKKKNFDVVYLSKFSKNRECKNEIIDVNMEENTINIGYIGGINHIYDFESLIYILDNIENKLNRRIVLHIIGDGERKEWLINQLDSRKIKYVYYGITYDELEKAKILSHCDWGFNGYNENTEVALSYKSVDYFSYGLPIINSTKGDTSELVDKYNIGINYSVKNLDVVIDKLNSITRSELRDIKKNVNEIYCNLFDFESFENKLNNIVKNLNKE